ncbi:MAG: radical SAM protein [Bacteroidetes bacterium]|nr:radical SAM protein [Bacteroidota bacterium]
MNFNKIINSDNLEIDEVVSILMDDDSNHMTQLFNRANAIRRQFSTDEIQAAGVIEFSNHCSENCSFCNVTIENLTSEKYRMDPDEIISAANQITNNGIKKIILQSGSDDYYDADLISYIIFSIKKKSNAEIWLSLGERRNTDYKVWSLSGAEGYLIKNTEIPKNISGIKEYSEQFSVIKDQAEHLRKADYQLGLTTLIGIPNQTPEEIAKILFYLKEAKAESIIFIPFVTELFKGLKNDLRDSRFITLKTIALARILLQNTMIAALPVGYIAGTQKNERGFNLGANLLITDFTPLKYNQFQRATLCNQFSKHFSKIPAITTSN